MTSKKGSNERSFENENSTGPIRKYTQDGLRRFLQALYKKHPDWDNAKIAVEGARRWCVLSDRDKEKFDELGCCKKKKRCGPMVVCVPKRKRCGSTKMMYCMLCPKKRRSCKRKKKPCRRRKSSCRKRKRTCRKRKPSCRRKKRTCKRKRRSCPRKPRCKRKKRCPKICF